MSHFGIATEALAPVEGTEYQRHLRVVNAASTVGPLSIASEIDYFNSLSGEDQIAFGD